MWRARNTQAGQVDSSASVHTAWMLLLALIAVVALWLAFRDTAPAPPAAPRVPSAADVAGRAATTPGDVRDELALTAPSVVTYRLRAIDAGDATPIAGATISWLPSPAEMQSLPAAQLTLLENDREAFVANHGERTTAGPDGIATITRTPGYFWVIARHGARFGSTELGLADAGTDTVHDIELSIDRALELRTVDVSGVPVAGIEVQGRILAADDALPLGFRHGPSDASGRILVRHVQEHVRTGRRRAEFRVPMIGGDGVPTVVDLDQTPDGPVDVVVPPFGSLEVTIFDPDGRPAPMDRRIRALITVRDLGGESESGVEVDDGWSTTIERVRLGRHFRVSCPMGAGNPSVEVDGPTVAGEVVIVELRMPVDAPTLTGRLLDAGGAPVVGSHMLRLEDGRGRHGQFIVSDESGAFCTWLRPKMVGRSPSVTIHSLDDEGQPTERSASTALIRPLATGPNALGDLIVVRPPILVAGRVRWDNGAAPQQFFIAVEYSETGDRWSLDYQLSPEIRADGEFGVRGPHTASRYRLQVNAPGATPGQPIEFTPGTTDLDLRLVRCGTVEVSCLVDPDTPWKSLEFRLRRFDADRSGTESRAAEYRGWNEFGTPRQEADRVRVGWASLSGGVYWLTIDGGDTRLAEIAPIAVVPGRRSDDPRLCDVDLRGRVHTLRVTVLDSYGARMRDEAAVVAVRALGDRRSWFGVPVAEHGGTAVVAVTQPVDLVVGAPGHRTARRSSAIGDVEVRLDAAPSIRLKLDHLIPDGVVASLELAPVGADAAGVGVFGGGRKIGDAGVLLGQDMRDVSPAGDAVFRPRVDGRFEVVLALRRRGSTGPIERVQLAAIDTAGQVDGAIIGIRVDGARLAAARVALAR